MKALALSQPWAGAAVLGQTQVLNLPTRPRHVGELLIYAHGEDRRVRQDRYARMALANMLGHEAGVLIGVVSATHVARPDECQLRFAVGPWCMSIREPRVFITPVPWPRFQGLTEIDDPEVVLEVAGAVAPRVWLRMDNRARANFPPPPPEDAPDPYKAYPPTPEGWRGD